MEILHTIESNNFIWVIFEVGMIISILIFTIFVYFMSSQKDKSIFILNFFSVLFLGFAINDYKNIGVKEYKVLINDMKQFDTTKYKIIEQEGKIFHIKEIKDN